MGKQKNMLNKMSFQKMRIFRWKKNGKGKEYYMGKKEYEGDFLNGERNGKGNYLINIMMYYYSKVNF